MEEDGKEFEDTIPHCWIDKENNLVRWPKKMKKGHLDKAIKAAMKPAEDWQKYKLIKIKRTSGKLLFIFLSNQVKMLKSMSTVELSNF